MMSPRLPLHLLTYARRARRLGAPAVAAIAACAATIVVATSATPVASAAAGVAAERDASQAWSPYFEQLRPVAAVDARRVVVVFDDPSLGDWVSASRRPLAPAQRRAWVKRSLALQQERLDSLAAAGVQFRVEHRYVRVVNGASILVHGDGAQLLRSVRGVSLVSPVRTIWPAASVGAQARPADDGAAGAAAAAGASSGDATRRSVRVAILDTAIDADHPALTGRVDPAFDATIPADQERRPKLVADEHGNAVASAVLRGAGKDADVRLLPVQVLSERPARDGADAVLGDSDDLLAGLEHAVDPDADGDTRDAAHVALVASTSSFAGFAGSAEDRAVQAADALGTVVVAASGNDGASGDDVGTVGPVAASRSAIAVGAADLRGRTPAADVRIKGGGIEETFEAAPVLTTGSGTSLPSGGLAVAAIDGRGDQVVDYLDGELRSRVSGAVALVAAREDATIAAQVRAAADAGAIAVLVGAEGADAAAATIGVRGADIPAIGIARDDARALREAIVAGERLSLTLRATSERNPAFGEVAGFSSTGPRLDGAGRPDLLAPGVGMLVAGREGWRTASGTSIAAAWAAGHVAALRGERPSWDPATVRATLMGSAIPLGRVGDRPSVALQGAGVVDAARAARAGWATASGRIDFGTVMPGSEARRPLGLRPVADDGAAPAGGVRILLDDGGNATGITPTLAGGELALNVPDGAPEGHVGGWLVLPEQELRIPWTATVRDAAAATVPLDAKLTSSVLRPVAGPGAFASTLTIAIGGEAGNDDALGLAAVHRLDVRLLDANGRDRGSIGGLDQALPGVYTFGLTGVDRRGKRLAAGDWKLSVRYVPASDPSGEWRQGPVSEITVEAARRAKKRR